MTSQELEEFIRKQTETIRTDPNDGAAYRWRADAHQKQGNYHAAIADYNKVIQLLGNTGDGYYWRGGCYEAMKMYQQALNDYDTAIKLGFMSSGQREVDSQILAFAYVSRGKMHSYLGHNSEALADLDNALRIDPRMRMTVETLRATITK